MNAIPILLSSLLCVAGLTACMTEGQRNSGSSTPAMSGTPGAASGSSAALSNGAAAPAGSDQRGDRK